MGVREEDSEVLVLGTVDSSITPKVHFFCHLVNSHFIDVFSQLLTLSVLSDSPTVPFTQSYSSITSSKALLHLVTIPKKIDTSFPTIAKGCSHCCPLFTAMFTVITVPAQSRLTGSLHVLLPNRPPFECQYGMSWYNLSIYYLSD